MLEPKWLDHRKVERVDVEEGRFELQLYPLIEDVPTDEKDMVGGAHISNVSIAGYYERCRNKILERLGYPGKDILSYPLMVQATMRYYDELSHPLALRLGSGIAWVGRSSFVMAQGLFLDGRCVGLCDAVYVNSLVGEGAGGGRSFMLAGDMLDRLGSVALLD